MEEIDEESIETADILTFDELLEDDYYRSEFEKRLSRELNIKNSHSDVKGGKTMDSIQQPTIEGENNKATETTGQALPDQTDNPAVKATEAGGSQGEHAAATETAKDHGMSDEQFKLYNETLRQVSKAAKGDTKYNAFEDAEAKAAVKKAILAGETPEAKQIAAEVTTRLNSDKTTLTENKTKTDHKALQDENTALKAEIALVKAGIVSERLEAAKKLFLAEGGDPLKVADFVKQYPEWTAQAGASGIVFTKAPPISGKTAAAGSKPPVMNDFEKRVFEARKAAGLPT